jgi:hypothetical protein
MAHAPILDFANIPLRSTALSIRKGAEPLDVSQLTTPGGHLLKQQLLYSPIMLLGKVLPSHTHTTQK